MTKRPTTPGRSKDETLAYSWFALGLLFVVALFNYVDRNLFSIMQVAVQRDLHLSDTQLGTLTGLSFAIFYTTAALPVAILADRVTRKYVLTVALSIWTLMTAASSLAGGYGSLLACRIGVALGEAGCVPASHSMLSDFFPRHRRALVLGIWCLALPFGSMLGFGIGGQLTAELGWRPTFAIIGLAGFLMAPILLIFLKEPERGRFDRAEDKLPSGKRPVSEAAGILWRTKSYRYLVLGEAIQGITQSGAAAWNAPFYSRIHHMPLGELALYLAAIAGIGGALGTFLGGAIAQHLARRDNRWYMRVPAIAALATAPFALAQYLVPDAGLSLAFAFVPALLLNVFLGPCNAVSQSLMPPDMRALTAAVFLMATSLVGAGLGPTMIGGLSDLLAQSFGTGDMSLRYALLSLTIPSLVAGWLFFASSRHLRHELAPMHREGEVAESDVVAAAASVT